MTAVLSNSFAQLFRNLFPFARRPSQPSEEVRRARAFLAEARRIIPEGSVRR